LRVRLEGKGKDAGLVAALRLRQWAHFLVLPLAAFDPALSMTVSAPALARGVVIAACILGFGYLLNALSDRRVDRERAKNPLVGFTGSTQRHYVVLALLALVALALAMLAPFPALVATLVALASGTLYSVGPRLKAWPIVGTLLNAGCFAPLLFVGLGTASIAPPQWALTAAFVGLLLSNQLVHEAADAEEDRAARLRTTFLTLGPRGTALFAFIAGAVALAASFALFEPLALLALPFALWVPWQLAKHGEDGARMRRLRAIHRVASAASGALLFAAMLVRLR
jgi:4-hydroxybenzoate polyprenyltransferase